MQSLVAPKKFVISSSASYSWRHGMERDGGTWEHFGLKPLWSFCQSLEGLQKYRITPCHRPVDPCRSSLLESCICFCTGSIWKKVWPHPNSLTLRIAFSVKLPLGHLTVFLSSTEKMLRIKFRHLEPSAEFKWLCEESMKQMKGQISYFLPRKKAEPFSSLSFFMSSFYHKCALMKLL